MSRYSTAGRTEDETIVVGFDSTTKAFFAQVWKGGELVEVDDCVCDLEDLEPLLGDKAQELCQKLVQDACDSGCF